MEATSFNCPSCGAAVAKDASECQYCHTLLQTVACPKCLGLMFAGTKFCPHCGVAVEKLGNILPAGAACPRCKAVLKRIVVNATPLDECTSCGGMWVSIGAFDHICSDEASQTAATGLQLPPPHPVDMRVHYISCPQCGKLMSRLNYGGGSGVIINVCRSHGIWLDRDELREIIDFIRAGGLDRMRVREHEHLESQRRMESLDKSMPSSLDLYASVGCGKSAQSYGGLLGALAHIFTNGF